MFHKGRTMHSLIRKVALIGCLTLWNCELHLLGWKSLPKLTSQYVDQNVKGP